MIITITIIITIIAINRITNKNRNNVITIIITIIVIKFMETKHNDDANADDYRYYKRSCDDDVGDDDDDDYKQEDNEVEGRVRNRLRMAEHLHAEDVMTTMTESRKRSLWQRRRP